MVTPSKVIDAHCHIFPEKIAQKAVANIGNFYGIAMDKNGAPSDLNESMCAVGLSYALVCSTATRPEQVESINDFIFNACEKYPSFIGFGTLHPGYANWEQELERIIRMGLNGIKLHPDFQEFNIDDERMIPVYRRIAEYNLPILFHTGDERYSYSHPERLYRVCDKVPALKAIAAHFGGYRQWDSARLLLTPCDHVYFDTSSSLFVLEPDVATEMINEMGEDRFFFGTDFPMWDQREELERFNRLKLTDAQRVKIMHDNFARFMGLDLLAQC